MLGTICVMLGLLAMPPVPTPATVPMQIVNNHVVVDVMLDGCGPFHFIVDSGAGNLIDPAVAMAIGARVRGHVGLMGVGGAVQNGALTTIARVDIGAATFSDEHFVVAAARSTFSIAEGPTIDGLIGSSIIGSGVTIFDYAQRTLTFRAADDALERDGVTVLPITSVQGVPHVACTIESVAGSCALDTGSRLDITILSPFGKLHPSLVPPTASAVGVDGYGIGGATYGRLGQLHNISLGSLLINDIVADFSVQTRGAFSSEQTSANVGGGILRRFALSFDLPHQRVGLRRNDDPIAMRGVDRSGLFLVARDAAIDVLDVRPGTAAQRAGIIAGDRVLSVDGQVYEPQTLPALRALLEQPATTRLTLRVARAGAPPQTLQLELADYF